MEGHAGEIRLAIDGGLDQVGHVVHVRAELPRERPVAADVRGVDAHVHLGIGLDRLDLVDLLDAVDHEPFHALGRRIFEEGARLHRVGIEHLGRRDTQAHEDVELGDRGDLEAGALLDQHFEDARVGIGLDGEMGAHPRQRRAETARLSADDLEVDDQDGLAIGMPLEVLLDAREVEADFRVGVEGELRLGAEFLYRCGSGHRGLW